MNAKALQLSSHQVNKAMMLQLLNEEEEYNIVRTKQFDLKPMDQEEAILQMNMLGHDFFIFTDADSRWYKYRL